MSVKLQWWQQVLESEEMSEAGKLRAARIYHLIEFPEDCEGYESEEIETENE